VALAEAPVSVDDVCSRTMSGRARRGAKVLLLTDGVEKGLVLIGEA
jgi:hypothetical protein